jgi:membrane protease YdiL (CAAX protease family)
MYPTPGLETPGQPEPRSSSFFFGPLGLHAAWSVSLFIAITFVLAGLLNFLALAAAGRLANPNHLALQTPTLTSAPVVIHAGSFILGDGGTFIAILLATFAMSLIERRSFAVYGINRRNHHDFIPGALTGILALSLLVFTLRSFHFLVFDYRLLFGRSAVIFGAKWLLACLCVGLMEEYISRGFLQYTLTRAFFGLATRISPTHGRAIAFSVAAFIMSLVFGAGHLGNAGENPMGLVTTVLAGILFSYSLWRTGSLWWAIGFHCTWDFAMNFLYGVPDSGTLSFGRLFQTHPAGPILLSGGIDGPEGSLLVIPTLILVYLVLRLTTQQAPQPSLEPRPHTIPTTLGL